MEVFQKYWGVLVAVVGVAAGAFGWIYNKGAESKKLEGVVFTSPEEKVEVVTHVKLGLTPEQRQRAYFMDSIEKASAIKAREIRLERERKSDSAKHVSDSLILDMVSRQAVQTQLQTQRLEKIEKKLNN